MPFSSSGKAFQTIAALYVIDLCLIEVLSFERPQCDGVKSTFSHGYGLMAATCLIKIRDLRFEIPHHCLGHQ